MVVGQLDAVVKFVTAEKKGRKLLKAIKKLCEGKYESSILS